MKITNLEVENGNHVSFQTLPNGDVEVRQTHNGNSSNARRENSDSLLITIPSSRRQIIAEHLTEGL